MSITPLSPNGSAIHATSVPSFLKELSSFNKCLTTSDTEYLWTLFVEQYPRRSGSLAFSPAKKRFVKLTIVQQRMAVCAAEAYRLCCERRGIIRTEYVAMAQTFMNQERWRELEDMLRQLLDTPFTHLMSRAERLEREGAATLNQAALHSAGGGREH